MSTKETNQRKNAMLVLKSPFNGDKVSLQTIDQKIFAEEEDRRANMDGALTFQWYDLEKQGVDRTIPLPVSFVWEDTGDEQNTGAYYYLLISEKADMSKAWVYITKDVCFDVYNLKVGERYYWCVQKNGKRSEIFSFETLLTLPRCLKIDRISNVRDMGGYRVADGIIRQGMVYRGGEFETHLNLEPLGAQELYRLGIRTELDMRGEAAGVVDQTTAECLGIKRMYIPSVPYSRVFDPKQAGAIKKFFSVLARSQNYPIYFHCWGGADRTGTFAFILGAFLGMRYEDLIYEYEFTSLSVWGVRSRNYSEFQEFLRLFMALKGSTLHEKSKSFLKEMVGLTDKQLLTIYGILVGSEADCHSPDAAPLSGKSC